MSGCGVAPSGLPPLWTVGSASYARRAILGARAFTRLRRSRRIRRDNAKCRKEKVMVTVTQKTVVTQRLQGRCTSHSRTDVTVRDRSMVIDEPLERGGTNHGFTPTETLMASLIESGRASCRDIHSSAQSHYK